MTISICITTFNEEGSIGTLLDSLLTQTRKANEIIIVDGGSTDKTVEILKHYQKKFGGIKLLIENCTRAEGRNLGIEIAKGDVIAITDAGCVAHKDWLAEITAPFTHKEVDISAGFYHMTGRNPVNRAMSVFLGVTTRQFGINFLPSTRSMAFRKSVWEIVGGFPEGRENSAEDTDFNYKAVKIGLKYARVKTAMVEWGMPKSIKDFFIKLQAYAKWDAVYGIWWHPVQGLASHNIKVLSIFLRYFIGFVLLFLSFKIHYLLPYLLIFLFTYLIWAYRKVYLEFNDWRVAIWAPVLQIVSDVAVMGGFIPGLLNK
jgi:glycosyltransferase involved in cell wall biosynthesis